MSSNLRLRELEPGDLPALNRWRNDPEVVARLGNNFFFIAESVDDNWYRNYMLHRDKAVRLAIEVDGRYVGNVNLTGIHPINRSAEFSIMIGERNYWGQGIGKEASMHMIRHGFNDLQLHRIWLGVLGGNAPAQKLYESIGFQIEGTQRQAIFKQGEYHDLILMGLLRSDFQ